MTQGKITLEVVIKWAQNLEECSLKSAEEEEIQLHKQ